MGVANQVVAGDYNGKGILYVEKPFASIGEISLSGGLFHRSMPLNKTTLASYEEYGHQQNQQLGFSALSGYNIKTKGAHLVVLNFKDGKRSLAQLNDKAYNSLIRIMF